MRNEERKEIPTLDLIYRLAVMLVVSFSFAISVSLLIDRAENSTSEAQEIEKENTEHRFEKLSEFPVNNKVSCYIYSSRARKMPSLQLGI